MKNPWKKLSEVNPQKENGYVGIANEVLEALVRVKLSGSEFSVCLYIIRKTWGYNKSTDALAVSQIAEATDLPARSIKRALRRLEKRHLIDRHPSNVWVNGSRLSDISLNKHYDTWDKGRVSKMTPVTKLTKTGVKNGPKRVSKMTPTKDIKDNTKDTASLHSEAVKYWCSQYQEKSGEKYRFQRGRDGKHVKDLLGSFPDKWRQMIDYILTTDDPWIAEGRRTLSILLLKANEIAQRVGRAKTARKPLFEIRARSGVSTLVEQMERQRKGAKSA